MECNGNKQTNTVVVYPVFLMSPSLLFIFPWLMKPVNYKPFH